MEDGEKISLPLMDIISRPKENFTDTEINAGFDKNNNEWELIVRYNGDIKKIIDALNIKAEILNDSYAIVLLAPEKIQSLLDS